MTASHEHSEGIVRLAVTVRGVVQGVGFRPFVFNQATARRLTGWVRNEAGTVQIEIQGDRASLDGFLQTLQTAPPAQARIEAVEVGTIPSSGDGTAFEIRPSQGQAAPRPTIPADLATCDECLAEIHQAGRRQGYPFTNCTNCGPRWSIISGVPYDRPRTSMAPFAMCPECQAEYDRPPDRRFHAQPIACPRCGPKLRLLDALGKELAVGDEALAKCVEAIRSGRIVALKGLGGFQLVVDATDSRAVAALRQRKRRPTKPFALLMASMDEARRHCRVSDEESRALRCAAAPIVLLRRREVESSIAAEVGPGNPFLGVMLPCTPLHHLLIEAVDRPVVCTSGNLSEEPMATSTQEALQRLGSIADVFLTHNRPIVRPVDDSVGQATSAGFQLLRRARGYAPLAIALSGEPAEESRRATWAACPPLRSAGTACHAPARADKPPMAPDTARADKPPMAPGIARADKPAVAPHVGPTVLAVGGHLKNTVALALGDQVVVGAHVGDLETVASLDVFRRAVRDLVEFFAVTPEVIACDSHPDYGSTRHAEALAQEWGASLVRVQHHHAHVAACMAEHGLGGPVLGFSWDGTGYGLDGTVWGGEALRCVGGDFSRVAHLRTFPLPGGDRAVREPRRSALGLLYEMGLERPVPHTAGQAGNGVPGLFPSPEARAPSPESPSPLAPLFSPADRAALLSMLAHGTNCPRTSSLGRLFDAVAALCGLPAVISFEGEAAMALQFAAEADCDEAYPLSLSDPRTPSDDAPAVADWGPMVERILADRGSGVPVGRISARFHNTLASLAVEIARRSDCRQIALTGGCFQNALLADRTRAALLAAGFEVYTHHQVPPGDGGLALGQVFVARQLHQG